MKIVFLQNYDESISEFAEENKPLQEYSKEHLVLFMASGEGVSDKVRERYKNLKVVDCETNYQEDKLNLAVKVLRELDDFDIVIRSCPDALIMDLPALIHMVETNINKERAQLMGNQRMGKHGEESRKTKQGLIRGPCQVWTKLLVGLLPSNMSIGNPDSFDGPLIQGVKSIDADIIDQPLIMYGDKWDGYLPAWHPPKKSMKKRLSLFSRMAEYGKPIIAAYRSHENMLRKYMRKIQPEKVLEWGPGYSTNVILDECPEVELRCIESDECWFDSLSNKFETKSNVTIYYKPHLKGYVSAGDEHQPFDLIFIDGFNESRVHCIKKALSLLSGKGVAILHDSYRNYYWQSHADKMEIIEEDVQYIKRDLTKRHKNGDANTLVFRGKA